MKKLILASILTLLASHTQAQNILIYGGNDHDIYLGCLNCNKYESTSIWNAYGTYGSKYSSSSIWNKYGIYGGQYSSNSPFNRYTSTPPMLVDKNGNFYGYFTANSSLSKRTSNKLALIITENWEEIGEDVVKAYDVIFD